MDVGALLIFSKSEVKAGEDRILSSFGIVYD